jgi:3-phytase/alkaline phosphatase D
VRRRFAFAAALTVASALACGDDVPPEDASVGGAGGTGGQAAGGAGGAEPRTLTFIDDFNLPAGMAIDNVPIGGLSGLWIDPASSHAWAICDDQNQYGPPRFYELDVTIDANDLQVTVATHIAFQTGATPAVEMDAEGIARAADGHLYVATEGDTTPVVAPAILRIDGAGALIEELAVDEKHVPDAAGTMGVRRNQGFESLTLSPSGRMLFTATEQALVQDGAGSTFEAGTRSRLLRYDLEKGSVAELVYLTDPVPPAAPGVVGDAVMGVAELLAFSDDELWVLERGAVQVDGAYTNTIRIYEVNVAGAPDVSSSTTLPLDALPLDKRLVLDLDEVIPLLDPAYPTLDNIEAMSFGSTLPDGRETVVLMSDDNFNAATQRTAFFAFAIE